MLPNSKEITNNILIYNSITLYYMVRAYYQEEGKPRGSCSAKVMW